MTRSTPNGLLVAPCDLEAEAGRNMPFSAVRAGKRGKNEARNVAEPEGGDERSGKTQDEARNTAGASDILQSSSASIERSLQIVGGHICAAKQGVAGDARLEVHAP